jgi:flagellar motor switch protein FliN
MTPSTVDAPSVADLTRRVVEAADHFPGDGLVAGPADAQTDLAELLTGDDAFVAVVPLDTPVRQELVVITRPTLLAGFGVDRPEALPAVLTVLIRELADGAAPVEAEIRAGVGLAGLEGVPVSGSAPGNHLVAAGIFLGTEHVATVGIAVRADAPSAADPAEPATPAAAAPAASPVDLPEVPAPRVAATTAPIGASTDGARSLNLLRNVEMTVTAELGRTRMTVAELLALTPGSVVELDRAAGTPIDLLVNGTLIARGEVVVIDEEFGLRISEIVDRVDG